MNAVTLRADIDAFASAVRGQLDDLSADEVDELTDDLVADLSDQAEESGDDFALPDAAGYAAELRAAAGLPPRSDHAAATGKARQWVRGVGAAFQRWSREKVDNARQSRSGAWLLDTAVALRPVWWIARAVVLALVLVPVLGIEVYKRGDLLDHLLMLRHPAAWVLSGALLLLSVQWGRGKWAPVLWLRVVRNIVNVLTAVIGPFVLAAALLTVSSIISAAAPAPADSWTPGLAIDRTRVRNIFAYDVDGRPIEQVQLFDQGGRPLTTVGATGQFDVWDYYFYGGGGPTPVGEQEIGRQPVWNVFPLREIPPNTWTPEGLDPADAAPTFPFSQVPSVRQQSSEDLSASPARTAPPTPAPVESPTP